MKRMIGAAILVAAIESGLSVAQAQAAQDDGSRDGPYISFGAGAPLAGDIDYDIPGGDVSIETGNGQVFSFAYGYVLRDGVRAEIGLSYSEQEIEGVTRIGGPVILIYEPPGDVQVASINAMAYFDLPQSGHFRPYVGLGAGLANIDLNDRVESGAGLGISARVVAGGNISLSDRASLFVEARYDGYLKEIEEGFGFSGNDDRLWMAGPSAVAGLRFGF